MELTKDLEGVLKAKKMSSESSEETPELSLGGALLILRVHCRILGDMVEILAVTLAWDWSKLEFRMVDSSDRSLTVGWCLHFMCRTVPLGIQTTSSSRIVECEEGHEGCD